MLIVGLTGGIACGKSTVAQMLKGFGAVVLSADTDARAVLSKGSPVLEAVRSAFPPAFDEAGLNRALLARAIFADPAERARLEAITHPAIIARMTEAIAAAREQNPTGVLVYETPLLYEAHLESLFNVIVSVVASPETQAARLQEREHLANRPPLSTEDIAHRLNAQIPVEEKARRADFIIRTDVALSETQAEAARLWEALTSLPSKSA